MVHLIPARLAEHGTHARAQICVNDCPLCGPIRERERARQRARRERMTRVSHEGKAARSE